MKIFSFCYFIVYIIFTITSVLTNSLYDNSFRARSNDDFKQYPVKRKVVNQEQPYFVAAREDDSYPDSIVMNPESQTFQKYRRMEENKPQLSLEKQLDLKRSTLVGLDKRADRLYKRDLNYPIRSQRRDEVYGIVYGNGRPIGILEPFPQQYEFAPFMGTREGVEEIEPMPPLPRRSAVDVLYPNDNRLGPTALVNDWSDNENNLQDEKYPAVLNDFKIDNRLSNSNAFARDTKEAAKNSKLDKSPEKREMKSANSKFEQKRNPVSITNEKIAELKSALNRIQNPGPLDKVTEIEDNLHDILSDMGLVDDSDDKNIESLNSKREVRNAEEQIKREADREDENLEEGLNRIEIKKADHDIDKRENKNDKKDTEAEKTKNVNVKDVSTSKYSSDRETAENNPELNELKVDEDSPSSLKSTSQNEALYGEENQNHVEVKRSTSKLNVKNYQKEGEVYIRSKRQESNKNENNDLMKGLEKSGDLTVSGNKSPLASSGDETETDKKRNKDQTTCTPGTSDKAKREQSELEYQKQIEQNIQTKIDAIKEQVKREIEALKEKEAAANKQPTESQRKKRETVNTLIEEETSALDPQKYPDEILIPHIRRRRNLDGSFKARRRIKRGLPDFSNLNNIDTGDYLDLTEQRRARDDSDPSVDYQADSQENLPSDNSQSVKDSDAEKAKAKRDTHVQDSKVTAKEDTPTSNQSEEKKSPESAQEIKRDQNVPNSPEAVQKRSVKTNYNSDPDLSDVVEVGPIQKNASPSGRAKRDSKKDNVKQKADIKNTPEDLTKKETKLKAEINTESSSAAERRRRQVEEEMDNEQEDQNVYNRRNKRGNAVIPYAKSAFFPYRYDDEDGDDEGDEFDEDSFEDPSALQKRDVYNPRQYRRSLDYQQLQDYDYVSSNSDNSNNNYQPEKRSLANKYVASMNSDVYANPNNYLYHPSAYVRRKRQDMEELAALHGGGPMLHHLAAIRERNMQNLKDDALRSKRNFRKNTAQNSGNQNVKEEPENIADLSDTDLFGALPQSYDGNNLLRFKRVKREATRHRRKRASRKEKQGAG